MMKPIEGFTASDVVRWHAAKYGRTISSEDLRAFIQLAEQFDCRDSATVQDADERIGASLGMRLNPCLLAQQAIDRGDVY